MAEYVPILSMFGGKKYEELFPSIPVLQEQDYFVQFNAYDVYLPKSWLSKSIVRDGDVGMLNIFEFSVLRLLAVNNFTVADLCDKLCLKPDLIRFILQQLAENGFLDKNHRLTDEGNKYIGIAPSDVPDEQEVEPFIMLVSRDKQQLIPMIFPKNCKTDGELEKPYVMMTIGSIGKGKTIKGRWIPVKEQDRRLSRLTQAQVCEALKLFNRNRDNDHKIRYNPRINIALSYDAPIYLHVKGVLQNGFVDRMVVGDGLNLHNDFLREYMERQRSDLFLKLKEQAVKFFSKKQTRPRFSGKYPEIREAMRQQKSNITNVDELKNAASKERQQVGNLIKAVEWALLYHLRKFPPSPNLLKVLGLQTPLENASTLLAFAKQLGLGGAKNYPSLFERVSGMAAIKCLETDNPSLAILLPVSIAAAVKVPGNRLVDALNVLPGSAQEVRRDDDIVAANADGKDKEYGEKENAFAFLARLDQYGREIRHSDEWHPLNGDQADKLYDNVRKFIETLLPDYDNPLVESTDEENISLQKLNAELTAVGLLGEDLFKLLSADLQEHVLKISSYRGGGQAQVAHEFILMLSIILEKIFLNILRELPVVFVSKNEIIKRLHDRKVSNKLATVNEIYYDRACNHQKATLGAYILAYMATLEDDGLDEFFRSGIPDLATRIIRYRGHGNRLGLVMDESTLFALRNEVFDAIKFLGGNNK